MTSSPTHSIAADAPVPQLERTPPSPPNRVFVAAPASGEDRTLKHPPDAGLETWLIDGIAALNSADATLQRAVERLTRGRGIDARSALLIQVQTATYVERVELASRIVDRSIGAVKTLMQSAGGG